MPETLNNRQKHRKYKQWGEPRTEPRSFPSPRWDHISVDNAYPGDCGGRLQVVRSPDGDRWVSGARCSISMGELSLVTFFGLAHRRRKFASKESSAYSKLSFCCVPQMLAVLSIGTLSCPYHHRMWSSETQYVEGEAVSFYFPFLSRHIFP